MVKFQPNAVFFFSPEVFTNPHTCFLLYRTVILQTTPKCITQPELACALCAKRNNIIVRHLPFKKTEAAFCFYWIPPPTPFSSFLCWYKNRPVMSDSRLSPLWGEQPPEWDGEKGEGGEKAILLFSALRLAAWAIQPSWWTPPKSLLRGRKQ